MCAVGRGGALPGQRAHGVRGVWLAFSPPIKKMGKISARGAAAGRHAPGARGRAGDVRRRGGRVGRLCRGILYFHTAQQSARGGQALPHGAAVCHDVLCVRPTTPGVCAAQQQQQAAGRQVRRRARVRRGCWSCEDDCRRDDVCMCVVTCVVWPARVSRVVCSAWRAAHARARAIHDDVDVGHSTFALMRKAMCPPPRPPRHRYHSYSAHTSKRCPHKPPGGHVPATEYEYVQQRPKNEGRPTPTRH
jgi:hypothetical protein